LATGIGPPKNRSADTRTALNHDKIIFQYNIVWSVKNQKMNRKKDAMGRGTKHDDLVR
jgi:hypothetical protein